MVTKSHCRPIVLFHDVARSRFVLSALAYLSQTADRPVVDLRGGGGPPPVALTVAVAISELGSTDLIFIETGVKINGTYYRDVLPAIKELSANDFFIFQQDSAPAHRARETVELLKRETPDFISPLQWPPNSPDLNPVDYKIWSVMQEGCTRHAYVMLRICERDLWRSGRHLITELLNAQCSSGEVVCEHASRQRAGILSIRCSR